MRTFSIIAAVITALLVACVGYAALTTEVGVNVVAVSSEPASNRTEAFTTVNTWVKEQNSSSITRFTGDELGDISNYTLVYLTVEVNNWSFMPAEWVQLQVQPGCGATYCRYVRIGHGAAAGQVGVPGGAADHQSDVSSPRQVTVEYYLLGRKYTATSAVS